MKTVWLGLFAFLPAHGQSYAIFTFDAPPGMTLARVQGVNTTGQVLGTYQDSSGKLHSLLRSPNGGAYTAIEVPGATQTYASGLNNPGQATGYYTDASGMHSFVRSAAGVYTTFDLPSEGGIGPPVPYAINDWGDIGGTAFNGAGVEWGFLLSADHTTYTRIQIPAATTVQVLAVSNNGDVTGTCRFGGSYGLKHGFIRKRDSTSTLIDAPGFLGGTSITGGNNRGQVIANNVVLNPDRTTAGLDPTLSAEVMAIDDLGRVAGCIHSAGGCRAFLAVPSTNDAPRIRPLRGVISASSFGGFETIAPGTWIEIYGSNLANSTRAWQASDFNGSAPPTSLDGVTVTINGRPAAISYVSPGQVNGQAPVSLSEGRAQVTVTNGNLTSAGYQVTVAAAMPGILAFSQDVAYTHPLAVYPDFQTFAEPAIVYPTLPPLPRLPSRLPAGGDTIVFFGIGFDTRIPLDGLEVVFQGLPAEVLYSGPAPGTIGLYQFNVVIPDVRREALIDIRRNDQSLLNQRLTIALSP